MEMSLNICLTPSQQDLSCPVGRLQSIKLKGSGPNPSQLEVKGFEKRNMEAWVFFLYERRY